MFNKRNESLTAMPLKFKLQFYFTVIWGSPRKLSQAVKQCFNSVLDNIEKNFDARVHLYCRY